MDCSVGKGTVVWLSSVKLKIPSSRMGQIDPAFVSAFELIVFFVCVNIQLVDIPIVS